MPFAIAYPLDGNISVYLDCFAAHWKYIVKIQNSLQEIKDLYTKYNILTLKDFKDKLSIYPNCTKELTKGDINLLAFKYLYTIKDKKLDPLYFPTGEKTIKFTSNSISEREIVIRNKMEEQIENLDENFQHFINCEALILTKEMRNVIEISSSILSYLSCGKLPSNGCNILLTGKTGWVNLLY